MKAHAKTIQPGQQKQPQKSAESESRSAVPPVFAAPQYATPADVLHLQQTAGNSAVTGWLGAVQADGALNQRVTGAIHGARSGGSSLPPVLRQSMEQTFGADFAAVRIHADGQANQLAHELGARAFTVGRDIFFRHGSYAPHTTRGEQTLRHELTHVIQQGGQTASHLRLGPENDVHEREAQQLSRGVDAPGPAAATAPAGSVQCIRWPWQDKTMKKLGGSANTVYRVKHKGGGVGYLKPNSANDAQMGARSVLSSDIDQSLGLNALAREEYKNYGKGKEGAESSEVSGTTITDNEFNKRITKQEYLTGVAADPSRFKMKKKGLFKREYYELSGTKFNTHDFSHPETQRGLANIQLQDAITGQNDRHGGNIKIDPVTHQAKAYDNDLMDLSHDTTLSRMKGLHKPTNGSTFTPEMRAKRDAARKTAETGIDSQWGKLVGLPSHIDEAAALRLRGMKSRAFIDDLRRRNPANMDRMTPAQIEELRNRYSVVRRYAKRGLAGGEGGPSIVRSATGGWNQHTYDAQVGQYAGRGGNAYHSYLQRSVLNYNDVQRAGGSVMAGDNLMRLDNPHAPRLPGPAPAVAPPPVPTVAPPPALVHPPVPVALPPAVVPNALPHAPSVAPVHPHPPVHLPVNPPGRGEIRVNRLRDYYQSLAQRH